jgi:hypothetical protein
MAKVGDRYRFTKLIRNPKTRGKRVLPGQEGTVARIMFELPTGQYVEIKLDSPGPYGRTVIVHFIRAEGK